MNCVDTTAASKISRRQLDRLAIVYVRQSTAHQVAEHRESADLQYQLRRRAVTLGWPDTRVLVIDDDQGVSGQSIDNRPGSSVCSPKSPWGGSASSLGGRSA